MRVKAQKNRNLYVLVIYAPRGGTTVVSRRQSFRRIAVPEVGETLRAGQQELRVRAIATRVETRGAIVEQITEVFTSAEVVPMPVGDDSVVGQFLRYHVLVRRFDGDPDAWLAEIEARGDDGGDLRFVRWIRSRMRQDPTLIVSIRRMVDATTFWRVAEA